MAKNKILISLFLKLMVVICGTLGVVLICAFQGPHNLLYFTIQSNIFIVICSVVGIVLLILELKTKKQYTKKWMYIVKYVATVAITLTGFVFCFVLVPTISGPEEWGLVWNVMNVFMHITVPACAIADFFVCDSHFDYKYKHSWFNLIPPIYYVLFATAGYVGHWDFGYGKNYPYFFLNWDTPCGAFGFSNELPYMAPNYWGILLLFFVFGLGCLYIKFIKGKKKKVK